MHPRNFINATATPKMNVTSTMKKELTNVRMIQRQGSVFHIQHIEVSLFNAIRVFGDCEFARIFHFVPPRVWIALMLTELSVTIRFLTRDNSASIFSIRLRTMIRALAH
jgi:hypothetical protein